MTHSFEGNRVARDAGCRFPIFNAPVGYFARAQLAGTVSAAGGMGLMETSSAGLAETAAQYDLVRAATDAPLGLQMFLRMLKGQGRVDEVLDWVLDGRTPLLVTCVGDPTPIARRTREAGVKLYHQVGSVLDAVRAVGAGVDGLIVEGAESGGLRSVRSPHLFTLLQQVRDRVDVPIVAAGGIADGHGMAGAFALGAEGVLMGTRFMSSAESPVHPNWKQAIADCDVTLNIDPGMPGIRMRVVGNDLGEAVFRGDVDPAGNPYAGPFLEAFEHGRLDKAMVGCGESASLVRSVATVREIIDDTVRVFWQEIERLAGMLHPRADAGGLTRRFNRGRGGPPAPRSPRPRSGRRRRLRRPRRGSGRAPRRPTARAWCSRWAGGVEAGAEGDAGGASTIAGTRPIVPRPGRPWPPKSCPWAMMLLSFPEAEAYGERGTEGVSQWPRIRCLTSRARPGIAGSLRTSTGSCRCGTRTVCGRTPVIRRSPARDAGVRRSARSPAPSSSAAAARSRRIRSNWSPVATMPCSVASTWSRRATASRSIRTGCSGW